MLQFLKIERFYLNQKSTGWEEKINMKGLYKKEDFSFNIPMNGFILYSGYYIYDMILFKSLPFLVKCKIGISGL